MRRGDLPLILLVALGGVAMALFVEGGAPARAPSDLGTSAAEAEGPLSELDPAVLACASGVGAGTGADAEASNLNRAVEQVSARVEAIRGLRFRRAADAAFLAPGELRERIAELAERELQEGEIRDEEEILVQLGAIPVASDLQEIATEALRSQVIGLYDAESRQLLVRSDASERSEAPKDADVLGIQEEIVLAHELEHALADQALGLREPTGRLSRADRELAYAAVVEGDATLTMQHYAAAHIGFAEQLAAGTDLGGPGEFEELPDYLQRSFVFPYVEGMRLACHRFLAGGWKAVDRLYAKPPRTTAQVIFPGRYGEEAPEAVRPPGDPGRGWQRLVRRELGAAELEWLFRAPADDPEAALPEPRELVFGWVDGELELWGRGDERALGIALKEARGLDRLCGGLAAWYRAGWPDAAVASGTGDVELTFTEPGRAAVLACDAAAIRLGIAPDPVAARRLAR